MESRPYYGTWIRRRKIFLLGLIALVFSAISMLSFVNMLFLPAMIPAVIFIYITSIVSMNLYRFSPRGGNWQNRIHDLLVTYAAEGKRFLDIGCGNGNLTIKLAKHFSGSDVVGMDYWGNDWEYSQSICDDNARIENVQNATFVKGTASDLPFDDGCMDCVVSCLTFHEVAGVKEDCIREALRVLNRKGRFVFMDLFDDPEYYPDRSRHIDVIRDSGCRIEINKSLGELLCLPFPLNQKQSLKYARIISGNKI